MENRLWECKYFDMDMNVPDGVFWVETTTQEKARALAKKIIDREMFPDCPSIDLDEVYHIIGWHVHTGIMEGYNIDWKGNSDGETL